MTKTALIIILISILTTAKAFSVDIEDRKKAYKYAKEAVDLMDKGQTEKAMSLLDRAIDLDPGNYVYVYEKALGLYEMSNYREAVTILDTLKDKDLDAMVWQVLGICYDFLGKKDSCILTLNQGLIKYPESGRLYMELGIAEVGRNEHLRALGYWENGVAKDPAFSENYYWLAKHYSDKQDKIWSLVYGEIYLNISPDQRKKKEIAGLLFNTYKSCFNIDTNNKVTVNMLQVKNNDEDFATVFTKEFESASQGISPDEINNLSIRKLTDIRSKMTSNWIQKGYILKFKDPIFPYLKLISDNKIFDEYNYYLFRYGNFNEFKSWMTEHNDEYIKFKDYISENIMTVNKDVRISRFKPEG